MGLVALVLKAGKLGLELGLKAAGAICTVVSGVDLGFFYCEPGNEK
jgi:hypothetical protein